jgi:uncharacterized protein YjbI with pentapeptide repeats
MEPEDKTDSQSTRYKEITKEQLTTTLDSHKLWIQSDGKEGARADLSKTNLKGAVIVGTPLQKAIFSGAYLYGAYLKRSNLKDADLSGANLRGANLRWADLQNANLSGTNLTRVDIMKADLRKADLSKVQNLSCDQLKSASIDKSTILPSYIKINWISEKEYDCQKVTPVPVKK